MLSDSVQCLSIRFRRFDPHRQFNSRRLSRMRTLQTTTPATNPLCRLSMHKTLASCLVLMMPQHRWAWRLWATLWVAVKNMLNKICCDLSTPDPSSLISTYQHPMSCPSYSCCYSHGDINLGPGRSGEMRCRGQWKATSPLVRTSTRPTYISLVSSLRLAF